MMDFWGLWSKRPIGKPEKDLARMGQGLFQGAEVMLETVSDDFGLASATSSQIGSNEAGIRQLPNGAWLVGIARIDNRDALRETLRMDPSSLSPSEDIHIVEQAYLCWGERCVEHLLGDWAFAVWQPVSRRLFLARDQFGISNLYYHISDDYIAFATRRKLLLALDHRLSEIDDLYLAQLLLAWKVYQGERTPHQKIKRLPPAHTLAISPTGSASIRCYWEMAEAVKPLPIRTIEEAAEGMLAYFDEAIRCRISPHEQIAISLSGGLDSSAVALTAAQLLLAQGRSISAYTSVPLFDRELALENRFVNEWDLAAVIARQLPNIRHYPVRAVTVAPLDGVREALWIHDGPIHAGDNVYWVYALARMAQADGAGAVLSGSTGNLGISWPGEKQARSASGSRRQLRDLTPLRLRRIVWRQRLLRSVNRGDTSALHPDLAQRVQVVDVLSDDPFHPLHPPITDGFQRRIELLGAGRTITGTLGAEIGAAFGVARRDPTADIRLLCYCLAVPPHLFIEPETGLDRMLIRTAMAGRVPDSVRLNQGRGIQAADILDRLRADGESMEECLDGLERSDAACYVNLPLMRQVWQAAQERNDAETILKAKSILLRGIMVGLFVQQPSGSPRPSLH